MQMAFRSTVEETILFTGWRTTDWQGLVYSMIGIVLMAAVYEALKSYREYLFINTSFLRKNCDKKTKSIGSSLFSGVHILQTFLHIVQIILSYFLMLIFMTYNVWLCVAIVFGAALGYWLFSWEKSSNDDTDCC